MARPCVEGTPVDCKPAECDYRPDEAQRRFEKLVRTALKHAAQADEGRAPEARPARKGAAAKKPSSGSGRG